MIYAGDSKNLFLNITRVDGATAIVSVAPVVSIVRMSDSTVVLNAQKMNLLTGSQLIYFYNWAIPANAQDGEYVALVSYAADGVTYNGRLMEIVRIGDSRVTGTLALDATVAKDASVAKDATVAHFTDLATIAPDTSSTIQAIKLKTDNLPSDPASATLLLSVAQNVRDLLDYSTGTWRIDKTQNPQVLSILRPSGDVLVRFQLIETDAASSRTPTF